MAKRKRTIRRIRYVPRGPSRRRAKKNPPLLSTALMVGGGALALFILYRMFVAKKAALPAPKAAALEPAAVKQVQVTQAAKVEAESKGSGLLGSFLSSLFGAQSDVKYAMRPNAIGIPVCWDETNNRQASHYSLCNKPAALAGLPRTKPQALAGGVLRGGRFGSLG